ncbi:MAG: hypothetical protein GY827_04090 [Cytophagales bacterium]|nr:hypothetical protein [Cytophagales bacterium]
MTKNIFFTFGVLLSLSLLAEEHLFNVLIVNGSIKKINNDKLVSEGEKLFQEDTIVLGKGTYLALVHKTGITVEVRKEGKCVVSSLAATVNKQKSFAGGYTKFVASSFQKKIPQKDYSTIGAVSRNITLSLMTPENTEVFSDQKVTVRWTKVTKAKAYIIRVHDVLKKKVYEQEIKDTVHTFSLKNFRKSKRYFVQVCEKGNPSNCDKFMMSQYNGESIDFQNVNRAFGTETAIDFVIKAKFYEKKGLLLQAQEFYLKAKKTEPNRAYHFLYEQFLHKYVRGI